MANAKKSIYDILPKDRLIQLYSVEGKSMLAIEAEVGISHSSVKKLLKVYGIPENKALMAKQRGDSLAQLLPYDDFYERFITRNMTYADIAKEYGVSEISIKHLNAKRYKVRKSAKDSTVNSRKTYKAKTGYASTFDNPEVRRQSKLTLNKNYGVANPSLSKDIREKRTATFMDKYGVANPFQAEAVKQKSLESLRRKYGDESLTNVSQTPAMKRVISRRIILSKGKGRRTNAQMDIANDSGKLRELIMGLPNSERTYRQVGELLGYDETAIANKIKLFDLDSLMNKAIQASKAEKDIVAYLKELGFSNIKRNQKLLDYKGSKKEIDIVLPDKKVDGKTFGLEFNGNYWHSENEKPMLYHQEKSLAAMEAGYFIFNIYEYEWEDPVLAGRIKDRLKNLLLGAQTTLYARKCSIETIDKSTKKAFLDKNHVQGNDHCQYAYGLYYADELVAVMTFCKSRFNKNADYELSRFATKAGYRIVGGASKLLSHFSKDHCGPGTKILSYSDIGKSTGQLYRSLGFSDMGRSKPSYVWWKSHRQPISRYATQMKNEIQTMHEKGYSRIFDNGNVVWILTV